MLDGQIEQDLSALLDSRTRPIPSPALRRLAATTNSEANAAGSADAPAVAAPAAETSTLIAEREVTHGSFDENARVWQSLCTEANQTPFINDRQRLAYSMIALKMARLLQNPHVRDHWDDIAGYARLGGDGC